MDIFTISVILWLADIVTGLSNILFVVGFAILVIIAILCTSHFGLFEYEEVPFTKIRKYIITAIVSITIGVIIPSKTTIYMIGGTIVGSKVIEKVAKTEEYEKLMELFNLSIDKQLKELKEEKNKEK